MRKVVDSNFLQSPALIQYLEEKKENFVVVTDYLAMEAYKGETLNSIFKSMEILCGYPKQVIILKSTLIICGIRGWIGGLQRRMIDENQTQNFGSYCQALTAAKSGGHPETLKQLMEFGNAARAQMDRIRADVLNLVPTFKDMEGTYTTSELKILRLGDPFTEDMIKKIILNILSLSRVLFDTHPKVHRLPNVRELRNTYMFRFSICAYVLFLEWIKHGGQVNTKIEKIHNDLVDLSFATYATFFNGLLSADGKLLGIYTYARFLIDQIFIPPKRRRFPISDRSVPDRREIASLRSQ